AAFHEGSGPGSSHPGRPPGVRRSDRERLEDLAEAIATIRAHLAARVRTDERLKRDAILYNLVIVGEAVKGLGDETKALRPDIPWRQIAGLRDLLTHEYFRIDMDEIEKIVERDLGPLEDAVRSLRREPAR
ncbi:MAG: HepT-like ribonuclease domain-containing protein, partial [Chloroflexota bacterium]